MCIRDSLLVVSSTSQVAVPSLISLSTISGMKNSLFRFSMFFGSLKKMCIRDRYTAGVAVTVSGTSVINGKVEISKSAGNTEPMKLNITGGTFNGDLKVCLLYTSRCV